jgi:hypothetical protein
MSRRLTRGRCPSCRPGYEILDAELAGAKDQSLEFVELGGGLGIAPRCADTAEQFARVLDRAIADSGPHPIEVCHPAVSGPQQLSARPRGVEVK